MVLVLDFLFKSLTTVFYSFRGCFWVMDAGVSGGFVPTLDDYVERNSQGLAPRTARDCARQVFLYLDTHETPEGEDPRFIRHFVQTASRLLDFMADEVTDERLWRVFSYCVRGAWQVKKRDPTSCYERAQLYTVAGEVASKYAKHDEEPRWCEFAYETHLRSAPDAIAAGKIVHAVGR